MTQFKYNIVTLLQSVQSFPCIWDKTNFFYKDKNERKNAWLQIFCYLEPGYEQMDENEKQHIGEMIIGKWQNIRDAFARSLRNQSIHGTAKKYVYYKYIKFLLNCDNEDGNTTELNTFEQEITVKNELDIKLENSSQMGEVSVEQPSFFKIDSEHQNKRRRDDIVESHDLYKRSFMNEDEAFFYSLYPSVSTMKEEEKLEFRMGVLRLIQKIKQRSSLEEKSNFYNSSGCSNCANGSNSGMDYILSD